MRRALRVAVYAIDREAPRIRNEWADLIANGRESSVGDQGGGHARALRSLWGLSARTRQSNGHCSNAGGLVRKARTYDTSRRSCLGVRKRTARLAVSRYVDVCLSEMATELGFRRTEGASSAAGNGFVR